MFLPRYLLAAILVLASACTESTTSPDQALRPAYDISAATGFYFLRPTVRSAPERFPGVFDPNRQLVVKVVCTGGTHERCPVLATFDRAGGGTGPLYLEKERYQADWKGTKNLKVGQGNYRLEVWDGTAMLGAGDLWVVASSSELKKVSSDHLGVVRGSVFQIRFRVETTAGGAGTVDTVVVTPDSTVVAPGQTTQLAAVARDASGNPVGSQVANWSSSDPAIALVSSTGLVTGVSGGRAVISATIGSETGSAVVRVAVQLPGQPGDPAAAAIPRATPVVNPAEYDRQHPALPGFLMSFTTALVATTPSATVAEINAVLADFGAAILGGFPGAPGQAGGILFLRFPTTDHTAMDALLTQLRGRPGIARAVADHEVGPTIVPAGNPAIGWIWSLMPNDDNWGMEVIRAPALWNWNAYVRKSGRRSATGVFDVGFTNVHPDLVIGVNQTPTALDDHGTHVAGTIGATFDNRIGVDGVNPFADLNLFGIGAFVSWAQIMSQFCNFVTTPPVPTVINVSLGYNWYAAGISTAQNAAARQVAEGAGNILSICLSSIGSSQSLPYVVAAAGNDGGDDARWASPWNAAALVDNVASIIVVEAADQALTPQLASFSNVNGHVSAPGVGIKSTANSVPYRVMQGTSMAAPHVAGLIGYLRALAPGIGAPTTMNNPLRDLLIRTGALGTGAIAPRVDAFAAAIELDQLVGGNQVLRALVDFDDGTSDGNRRADASGTLDTNEDADGDGDRGDGRVDMADFRRWRDWLLDVEQAPGLSLDGRQNVGKLDQNADREYWSTTLDEGDHSRGDLNGDGVIHRSRKAVVGGAMGGRSVTDLEVLAEVFSDPVYTTVELPGLLDSGDITVEVGACIDAVSAAAVAVAIQVNSDTSRVVRQHRFSAVSREIVFTVPPDPTGYAIRVAALDPSGSVLQTWTTTNVPVALAGDAHRRACGSAVTISPNISTVAPGRQVDFTATIPGQTNQTVTWTATGGSISSGGRYFAGSTTGAFSVTATSVADPTLSGTLQFQISPSGYDVQFYTVANAGGSSCGKGKLQQAGTSANLSVSDVCAYPSQVPQTGTASVVADLMKGQLAAGFRRNSGPTSLSGFGGAGSFQITDQIVIDAPGLTGSAGTFQVEISVTGGLGASGTCSPNQQRDATADWSVGGRIGANRTPGAQDQELFIMSSSSAGYIGGWVGVCASHAFGILPPVLATSQVVMFTYGTPFWLTYVVAVHAATPSNPPAIPYPGGASAVSSIGYRWLGMNGLPPGTTVTSVSGADWSKPAP